MNGMQMDPDFLSMLSEMTPEELSEMFYPYQQEQGVLGQEMDIAKDMRQPGMQRSTPMGVLLGGLSNAAFTVGGAMMQKHGLDDQRALGTRMQKDGANRMQMLERLLRQRAAGGSLGGGFIGLDKTVA